MKRFAGWLGNFDELRRPISAAPAHAVQHLAVNVDVQVGSRAKALDQHDGAAVGLVGLVALETGLPEQVARDQAVQLGIRRDVANIGAFDSNTSGSSSVIGRWGQRGRIGEQAIKPRVRAIVSALTPWIDIDEIERLPVPIALRVGKIWTANLGRPTIRQLARALQARPVWLDRSWLVDQTRDLQRRRPGDGKRLPATGN